MTAPHWVYELSATDGRLLYIGVTGNLSRRLAKHQHREWWGEVARIEIDGFLDRATADITERDRIRRHQPAYNDVFTDSRTDPGGWIARRRRTAEMHAQGRDCADPICSDCRLARFAAEQLRSAS